MKTRDIINIKKVQAIHNKIRKMILMKKIIQIFMIFSHLNLLYKTIRINTSIVLLYLPKEINKSLGVAFLYLKIILNKHF
jgi:hypothetical protein